MIIDPNSSLIDHRREAHSSSALAIPEIVSNVVRHVPLYHMPACARVSKSWYQAFMPFIWENVSLDRPRPSLLEAAKNHHRLVKTLTLDSLVPQNAGLRFPNLKSLSLRSFTVEQQHSEFILNHSDIAALGLNYHKSVPGFALWDALSGFRHLRELSLTDVTMDKKDMNAFWQVCTLLELGVFYDVHVADQSSLSCFEFPRMKKLHISTSRSGNNVLLFLEFAQKCPRLESCHWGLYSKYDDVEFLPGFVQPVAAKTWPNLHEVVITGVHKMTRNQLFEILEGMQRITILTIHCDPDIFTPSSMTLLRPQFSNLRILFLGNCNSSVMCPMAQEILSSCPLLEEFSSTWIDADLVIKGKPWVCFGLKKLVLGFVFSSSTLPAVQPIVFDQLARLTRLEHWCLWPYTEGDVLQDTVALKLEYGLGKLQTLRELKYLILENTLQEMEDQEIDWILKHWKALRYIRGRFCLEQHREQALTVRLQEHGIFSH